MAIFPHKPIVFLFLLFIVTSSCFAQLQFVENKGQWEKEVSFKSDLSNGAFFLQKAGFTVVLNQAEDLRRVTEYFHGNDKVDDENKPVQLRSHAYKISFKGASKNAVVITDKELPGYSNYFIGSDKTKWKGNCKSFESVVYKNIYPNIDLHYYTIAGKLKYDIIIHPGGNVKDIAIQYEGVNDLSVKNNELIIGTSVGKVKEEVPYTYQTQNEKRTTVSCSYNVKGKLVTFNAGQYNPAATLVIDPTVIFTSFTGSTADNWGYTATPGPDGSFFAGGICFATGFPVSLGAFQQTFQGGVNEDGNGPYDISIFKFSSTGSSRLYATYLGGSANEQPQSMICDAQNNLIVTGRTKSSNFPALIPRLGVGGGYDILVSKFNVTGTMLIGSLIVGGTQDDGVNISPKYITVDGTNGAIETRRNYGDDARSEVILDAGNNVYLASCTKSVDFPVIGSAIQTTFGGGRQDGVILKFPPNISAVTFSTYFGGTGSDGCFSAAISPSNGNLYISGATTSPNLPGDITSTLYPTNQGGATDGFITEIAASGASIIKTTFIGTSGNDMVYGLQIDALGYPYITGTTTGNFPVFNAPFSNFGSKQFISKIEPNLSTFVYSTVFGTSSSTPNISPTAFYVDNCQNVYVVGWGGAFNNQRGYPCAGTTGMPITVNPIKATTDGNDFYLFVLQRNAASQLYGSFFGQTGGFDDHTDGGTSRFDLNSILYQAECANCGNSAAYPTTPGAWATLNGSGSCNEAAIKIDMSFDGAVNGAVKATFNGIRVDSNVCTIPATIQFTDTVARGKKYSWSFGDGSPVITTNTPTNFTTHTYSSSGTFKVVAISIDSASCNIADTSILFIKINTCNQSCASSATKYTANISGVNYQWQINTGAGFVNLINNTNYSGANTFQIKIDNAPTTWYGYQYRCVVDGNYSNSFTLKFVNYWLGAISNAWENPANWGCGVVPDAFTDVVINSGTAILSSNTSVAVVTVTPGANFIVNPIYRLTILGH